MPPVKEPESGELMLMKSMVSLSLIYRLNAQGSFGPRLVEATGDVP